MEKIRVSDIEKDYIVGRLKETWDINEPYWYPLFPCNRGDVIAFNTSYISDKKISQISKIFNISKAKTFFELKENGVLEIINKTDNYSFWKSEDYFWNNEGYWFDDSYSWLIYSSHEQTITFGGNQFIKLIKELWCDWSEHIRVNGLILE